MAKPVRQFLFPHHNPYEGLKLRPFNSHGWASQSPVFAEVFNDFKPELVVEIGTWMGGSARTMAKLMKEHNIDGEIVCIDTFLGSYEHWNRSSYLMPLVHGRPDIYEQFLSNTVHEELVQWITPFPVDSLNGYWVLRHAGIRPDMVYIDAGHDYESVSLDINRWHDILKPGGVLVLDDAHHPPVQKAVRQQLVDAVRNRDKFIWKKR